MGLDMYLTRKAYVKNWNHQSEDEWFDIEVKKGGKEYDAIDTTRIKYLIEDVGYWRKANAIHQYFVEMVQGGEDDCGEYYVEENILKELLGTCQSLKSTYEKNKDEGIELAKQLLPVQSGFFFGSTEYDEYYWDDIDSTIKTCKRALKNYRDDTGYIIGEYYYQSSW